MEHVPGECSVDQIAYTTCVHCDCTNTSCHWCHCRDATGKFPDYPDEEEGGSEAVFKKREEPVSSESHSVVTIAAS